MRLHRLKVTAFGPFAEPQEIDFDALSGAGVFLLHGPTGAGKTSVLDAVCYALYASVPGVRQNPGNSLRSDHAAPETPTEVTLELTAGGRRLEITRRPEQDRPKKRGTGTTKDKAQSWLREYDGENWTALSRSHQEIGEEVEQLLGMSRDQFCQVVLLPQGSSPSSCGPAPRPAADCSGGSSTPAASPPSRRCSRNAAGPPRPRCAPVTRRSSTPPNVSPRPPGTAPTCAPGRCPATSPATPGSPRRSGPGRPSHGAPPGNG